MATLLTWLVVVELAFVGFGVLGASSLGMEKRPRFLSRLLLAYLATLSLMLVLAGAVMLRILPEHVLMPLWLPLVFAAPILGPTVCYRSAGSASDSSDADAGGGSGPHQPSPRPTAPRGGVPLPDADQATVRVRDHASAELSVATPRRRTREPERTSAPGRHA
jgi:hypothetical protein